jgi:hypothetical protein
MKSLIAVPGLGAVHRGFERFASDRAMQLEASAREKRIQGSARRGKLTTRMISATICSRSIGPQPFPTWQAVHNKRVMRIKGFPTIADKQKEYVGSSETKCESVGVKGSNPSH